jgi:hypothetical protein
MPGEANSHNETGYIKVSYKRRYEGNLAYNSLSFAGFLYNNRCAHRWPKDVPISLAIML